jgi:hypothetical protein
MVDMRAMRYILAAVISAMPIFAHATVLKCTVKTYDHSGFAKPEDTMSWFPKETAHELKDGNAFLFEQSLTGKYVEQSDRIKITYDSEDIKKFKRTVIYTFFPKTGVFSVKLGAEGEYAHSAGTIGSCKLK